MFDKMLADSQERTSSNFNWHVYATPSLFLVHLRDLENAHRAAGSSAISRPEIAEARTAFEK
jgi:hypothetical protein